MFDISRVSTLPRSCILLTSLAVFLFCGGHLPVLFSSPHIGYAAGIQNGTHHHVIQYADVDIEGPPTLSAATIDKIFTQLGSPMAGTGTIVEYAAHTTQIDDAFALAVWWAETNDGEAGVGRTNRNPGSVRGNIGFPTTYDGYTVYSSYAIAVVDWFHLLRNHYLNRGFTTVYDICHPYVATTSAEAWAAKVVTLIARYHLESPAATVQDSPMLTGPRPLLEMESRTHYHALLPDRTALSIRLALQRLHQQSGPQRRGTRSNRLVRGSQVLPRPISHDMGTTRLSLAVILTIAFTILIVTTRRRRKLSPNIRQNVCVAVPPTPALISMQAINPIPLTPFIADFIHDQRIHINAAPVPQVKRVH